MNTNYNLHEAFVYVLDKYLPAKTEQFKEHPIGSHVRQRLTAKLVDEANINTQEYLVTGSVGQGQWAEVPWIGIFLKKITTTATKGYDVVYLFPMSGVYVSLNQGWTYFKEKYGSKQGGRKIKTVANAVRDKLHMVPDRLTLSMIDLKGEGPLSRGYEKGHIIGRFYSKDAFPSSEEIIRDLQDLLVVYREVDVLIKGRSVDQFNDYLLMNDDGQFDEEEEEAYQRTVQKHLITGADKDLVNKGEPIPRPEPVVQKGGKECWPRNATIAAEAIRQASYQCELVPSLPSFTSKQTGYPFMEAHHLVPMHLQSEFAVSLDQVENIVCLSPYAHRLVHHALDIERETALENLFEEKIEGLKQVGIYISFNDLKNAYQIKS
ncbi:DUF3578 domain-containing protein [Halobacillus sp. Marseille-Q1614]|uniref:DUF3578 domain-containing protein n=1 Tax=Halobacillus sp. Marseille-Q1614 TaxID=2709134 RepID=UPI00156D6229|nr:DUF3578 domain-containing protein [Halobacillus sp. Marseille-Q1614]